MVSRVDPLSVGRRCSLTHAHLADHVQMTMWCWQVWPICGDGLDFTVRLTPSGPRKPQMLLQRSYEPDPDAPPNRQKIEWQMHIRTGDRLDFLVDPRGNHDCDGLYIVDVQVWIDDKQTL